MTVRRTLGTWAAKGESARLSGSLPPDRYSAYPLAMSEAAALIGTVIDTGRTSGVQKKMLVFVVPESQITRALYTTRKTLTSCEIVSKDGKYKLTAHLHPATDLDTRTGVDATVSFTFTLVKADHPELRNVRIILHDSLGRSVSTGNIPVVEGQTVQLDGKMHLGKNELMYVDLIM